MATSGTYGGQCELVAFCRAYDRDVMLHRPEGQYQHETITSNDRREAGKLVITLHISYGDERDLAHYDSVRRSETTLAHRRKEGALSSQRRPLVTDAQIEAAQRARPSLLRGEIHDFLEKGKRDLDANYQLVLKDRGRSSSASSSQRSSSSKRSLEDDDEVHRASKRADRRKSIKKLKSRTVAATTNVEQDANVCFQIWIGSQEPGTPASTQDTECSSDATDAFSRASLDDSSPRVTQKDESSDSGASLCKPSQPRTDMSISQVKMINPMVQRKPRPGRTFSQELLEGGEQ